MGPIAHTASQSCSKDKSKSSDRVGTSNDKVETYVTSTPPPESSRLENEEEFSGEEVAGRSSIGPCCRGDDEGEPPAEDERLDQNGEIVPEALLAELDSYGIQSEGLKGMNDLPNGGIQNSLTPLSRAATQDTTTREAQRIEKISRSSARPADRASTPTETPNRRWKPWPLRRPVLLGFAILFTSMIVALEILDYFSNRNKGLATVSEHRFNLWKFWPTFLLTIITTLWSQVEYRTRQMMPWMIMTYERHQSGNSKGFTLNYLTSSIPESLYRSLKAGHLPVVFGMLGTLMLRLVIIFSTGLFVSKDQEMTQQGEIQVLDRIHFYENPLYDSVMLDSLWAQWTIDTYGVPYPPGTSSKMATQSFLVADPADLRNISMKADVFEAPLEECETFSKAVYWEDRDSEKLFPARFLNPVSSFCWYRSYGDQDALGNTTAAAVFDLNNNIGMIGECSNVTSKEGSYQVLILFPLQTSNGTIVISGMRCIPKYNFSRRQISSTSTGSISARYLEILGNVTESLHLGIAPVELTQLFVYTAGGPNSMNDYFDHLPFDSEKGTSLEEYQDIVYFLNETMPRSNATDFSNPDILREASQRFFQSEMALLVKSYFTRPVNMTTLGDLTSVRKRICIGQWSLRLMEAFLTLLSLSSMLLCFFKYPSFLIDPAPLAAHAVLLHSSPDLESNLRNAGQLPKKTFKSSLYVNRFACATRDGNKVSAIETHSIASREQQDLSDTKIPTGRAVPSQQKWWQPLASSWPYRIVILSFTIALVVSLEVLRHSSAKNNGILDAPTDTYGNYGWLYIPSLVMASTGLVYSALDSAARVLHPFQESLKGKMHINELFFEPLGDFTVRAITHSMSRVTIPSEKVVALNIHDWFFVGTNATSGEVEPFPCYDAGQLTASAIQFSNLSYLKWTFESLALPEISIDLDRIDGKTGSASSFNTELPSLYPQMNCTLQGFYTRSNLSVTGDGELVFDTPSGCHSPQSNKTLVFDMGRVGSDNNYVAIQAFNSTDDQLSDTADTRICQDGRAHLWFLVARAKQGKRDDLSLVHCTPYVEIVRTHIKFSLPNFDIDLSVRPTTQDTGAGNRRVFSNITMLPTCMPIRDISPNTADIFGSFFTTVFYGYQGVPIEDLLGPANSDRLIHRMQKVYAQTMVQVLHNSYPIASNASAFPDSDVLGPMNGTVTFHRERLVQSTVATWILEGILATMALCAVIHVVLTPKTRILPKDPGSIASKMSLFAGSELVRRIPDNNEELGSAFEGEIVSLGWWDNDGSDETGPQVEGSSSRKRFGFDVGVAEKAP